MEEGLFVIDPEGKILLTNAAPNPHRFDTCGREILLGTYQVSPAQRLVDEAQVNLWTDEIELEEKIYLCSITPIRAGKAKIVLLP